MLMITLGCTLHINDCWLVIWLRYFSQSSAIEMSTLFQQVLFFAAQIFQNEKLFSWYLEKNKWKDNIVCTTLPMAQVHPQYWHVHKNRTSIRTPKALPCVLKCRYL